MTEPIDQGIIGELLKESRTSPRKRAGKLIVPWGEQFNALGISSLYINCLQPGTYVRPHKHDNAIEEFMVHHGAARMLTFNSVGALRGVSPIVRRSWKGVSTETYHSIIVDRPDTIMLDVYRGTAQTLEEYKQFAPWAPAEDDPAAQDYLDGLLREANQFQTP